MPTQITLSDWETLKEELRRFGTTGEVTIGDGRIVVDFGAAHIEISRDGSLETGMPLHDFAQSDISGFVLDHDAGTLTVNTGDVNYTFRRPGGR